jgi:lipopolysaccharide transport system permease protein
MMTSLAQIYRHRALAEILVGRELKARYRGTLLGFLWSFANPLLMMCIYVLVFAVYMRVDIKNFAVFLLCGLLPWSAFVAGLTEGMASIIGNGNLIKKVHLPTEVFPFVSVASSMVHFLLSIPVLLIMLLVSGIPLSPYLLFFPVIFLLQFFFTFALALILSSFAVQFRDLMHIVPNLVLVWFYLTPIVYAPTMVTDRYRVFIYLNPLTWLIEAYRDIFLNFRVPSLGWLSAFALTSALLMALGMWLFNKRSDLYAELV